MGSTVCVRCGATLIPHSYCDICHDILCFTCSSCTMNTVERIHTYCSNASSRNNDYNVYLQDIQKLMEEPKSSQLGINNDYVSTHFFIQNQFNDNIKDSSIKLSTSYWFNIFESIKIVNRFWSRIFGIYEMNTFHT